MDRRCRSGDGEAGVASLWTILVVSHSVPPLCECGNSHPRGLSTSTLSPGVAGRRPKRRKAGGAGDAGWAGKAGCTGNKNLKAPWVRLQDPAALGQGRKQKGSMTPELKLLPGLTYNDGYYKNRQKSQYVLGRIWRTQNPRALLVGMEDGAAPMEHRTTSSPKVEQSIAVWSTIPRLGIYP